MAFNGSGAFVRLYNWVNDRNAAIKIRADRMDGEMDGFATGLSNCITKDGQTTITQNIPFNNKRITGLADAAADTDALNRQTADNRLAGAGATIINGTIVQSRSGSAETFAVKTAAGADPTVADPVRFAFQTGGGTLVVRTVTAALSVTISSGSTLGTTNAVPFRLWVIAADDGGTVRLGVVKTTTGTSVMTLPEWATYSSTAEGGAGAADSAQVIYSTTAFTSKYIALAGFADWEAGLATAGTWNTAPTRTVLFGPGVARPGDVVQIRHTAKVDAYSSAVTGTSTAITGLSVSITPRSAANLVEITPVVCIAASTIAALQIIRGSTNIGGGTAASNRVSSFSGTVQISDTNSTQTATAQTFDAPAVTTATTYQINFVLSSGGSIFINRTNADSDVVGVGRYASTITATEIMA